MKNIEELWINGFTTNHRGEATNPHCRELCRLIERNEQELLPLLSDEAKAVFEKMKDNLAELEQYSESEIFSQGFRLGARLMMDVLDDSDTETLDD